MMGEINMAPMMTAVLFILSPTDAIMMAMNRMIRFMPVMRPPSLNRCRMTALSAVLAFRLTACFRMDFTL